MDPMKIFVCGRTGRMSLAIRNLLVSREDLTLSESISDASVLIDFTAPEALYKHLALALKQKVAFVCGTTGLKPEHHELLEKASHQIPVLWASNTSIGANLLFEFTRMASRAMPGAGIQVEDTHHIHKKDSPSGTALTLKEASGGRAKILSKREGEIAGIHTVTLETGLETLVLKHEAHSRDIFAQGALQAAHFLIHQKPGFYEMRDVLRLGPQ